MISKFTSSAHVLRLVTYLISLTLLFSACQAPTAPTFSTSPLSSTSPAPTLTPTQRLSPTASRTPRPIPPTPTAAPPVEPLDGRRGGLIAFYSERGSNAEIYLMNVDASDQRLLANLPGDNYWPFWGSLPEQNPSKNRLYSIINPSRGFYPHTEWLTKGENGGRQKS